MPEASSPLGSRTVRSARAGVQLLYLFCYMAWGALFPFLNLHYRRLGLSGVQIGTLSALTVAVGTGGALVMSGFADRYRAHRLVLVAAMGAAIGAVLGLSGAGTYGGILVWAATLAVVGSPISPLVDRAAVEASARSEGGYGRLRVWGTVGWALSTVLLGEVARRGGLGWTFRGYALFMGGALLVALTMPIAASGAGGSAAEILRQLRVPRTALFLGGVFLLGVTLGAGGNFLSLYLEDLGATETVVGLAWTVVTLSEIPVMWGAKRLLDRLGALPVVTGSVLLFALRWFLLSLAPSPAWALATQLLHGGAFAAFLAGGVLEISALAPPGATTTALAVFNTLAFGVSSTVGAVLGGYLCDTLGLRALFQILALGCLVAVAVLGASGRMGRAPGR